MSLFPAAPGVQAGSHQHKLGHDKGERPYERAKTAEERMRNATPPNGTSDARCASMTYKGNREDARPERTSYHDQFAAVDQVMGASVQV
jgi:hypothetical protein